VCSEVRSKAEEELSKRKPTKLKEKKTLAELSLEKERTLEDLTSKTANMMILDYYKRKRHE
jgi:hypothetical protein